MARGESKALSQAIVDGCWNEVGESRELPRRPKWALVESAQDGFIGVVDRLSIASIGGLLSQKRKCRFTKPAGDCAGPHDIGPERGTILL
jgi:hypothetical protein